MSGWRALFAAVAVSGAAVVATVGTALAVRPSQFSTLLASRQKVIVSQDVRDDAHVVGRRLFVMNCAKCHGRDARGDFAPDLYDVRMGDALIHQVITDGINDEMPSYAKKFTETDMRALIAYLRTLRSSGTTN